MPRDVRTVRLVIIRARGQPKKLIAYSSRAMWPEGFKGFNDGGGERESDMGHIRQDEEEKAHRA